MEDNNTKETQTTPDSADTAAGRGCHDAPCCASSFSFDEVPADLKSNGLKFNLDTGYLRVQSFDGEDRIHHGTMLSDFDPIRAYLLDVHTNVLQAVSQAHKKTLDQRTCQC